MKTTTTTTTTPFPQVERLLALLSARQTIEPASVNPSLFPGCLCNCVTQLKLYTLYKLSSPIFCCLSGIGVTQPKLHFFQYIEAYKPFADHVPPNTKQYQLREAVKNVLADFVR